MLTLAVFFANEHLDDPLRPKYHPSSSQPAHDLQGGTLLKPPVCGPPPSLISQKAPPVGAPLHRRGSLPWHLGPDPIRCLGSTVGPAVLAAGMDRVTALGRDAQGLTSSDVHPTRVMQPRDSTDGKQNSHMANNSCGMAFTLRHRVHRCCQCHLLCNHRHSSLGRSLLEGGNGVGSRSSPQDHHTSCGPAWKDWGGPVSVPRDQPLRANPWTTSASPMTASSSMRLPPVPTMAHW